MTNYTFNTIWYKKGIKDCNLLLKFVKPRTCYLFFCQLTRYLKRKEEVLRVFYLQNEIGHFLQTILI